MRWASGLSEHRNLDLAVDEAAAAALEGLGGAAADLAIAFVGREHAASFERLTAAISRQLGTCTLFGCCADGVIGAGREVEHQPSVSITVAQLPDVSVTPFHLEQAAIPAPQSPDDVWQKLVGVRPDQEPQFLLIGDPFGFDVEPFLLGLDRVFPGSNIAGGLASGADKPGNSALFVGDRHYQSGLVGLALTGNIRMQTLVAQGCRPIGEPMFVTATEQNLLRRLDGREPLEVLKSLFDRVDERDQELMQHSLFMGIAMNSGRQSYGHGDFLIRNIVGADQESGALAIGAALEPNAVVQFHVRDARTSAEDLESLLENVSSRELRDPPAGSLLFSCLGRGRHLYGEPDHDTKAFQRHMGPVPVGGFFCNGEIGPVHGSTFLHGYTSAFALFRAQRS